MMDDLSSHPFVQHQRRYTSYSEPQRPKGRILNVITSLVLLFKRGR